ADGRDVRPPVAVDVLDGYGEGAAEELDVAALPEAAASVPREDRDRHGAVVGGDQVEMPIVVQGRGGDAARGNGGLDGRGGIFTPRLGEEDAQEPPLEDGPAGDDVPPAVAVQVAECDAKRFGALDEREPADGVAWGRRAAIPHRAPGAAAGGTHGGERSRDTEQESHGAVEILPEGGGGRHP